MYPKCSAQLNKKQEPDPTHWACLTESQWCEMPAVQVVSWRMLNRLRDHNLAADAIELMYFDESTLAWAKAIIDHENSSAIELHRDCNGNQLFDDDTVVLKKHWM